MVQTQSITNFNISLYMFYNLLLVGRIRLSFITSSTKTERLFYHATVTHHSKSKTTVPRNEVPYGYRLCLYAVFHEIQGRPDVPLLNGVAAYNTHDKRHIKAIYVSYICHKRPYAFHFNHSSNNFLLN
jgi:hypothetical protein